jgi:RNA:NAD 2'-phosphotransferase (TPT1/KptA family)
MASTSDVMIAAAQEEAAMLTAISKQMCYVLRHTEGVVDADGWMKVSKLVTLLRIPKAIAGGATGRTPDVKMVLEVAECNGRRFQIDTYESSLWIRARGGHTVSAPANRDAAASKTEESEAQNRVTDAALFPIAIVETTEYGWKRIVAGGRTAGADPFRHRSFPAAHA